jgi:hypothetical protein
MQTRTRYSSLLAEMERGESPSGTPRSRATTSPTPADDQSAAPPPLKAPAGDPPTVNLSQEGSVEEALDLHYCSASAVH